MEGATVIGEISWQGQPGIEPHARLYVRLIDATEADRPSRTVAETVINPSGTAANPAAVGTRGIPFVLALQSVDPRRRYIVAAHLDLDGDGKVSPGDQINAQSYPVLTMGNTDRVQIALWQI
jgi:uncharacterized lipoprotein YbaY